MERKEAWLEKAIIILCPGGGIHRDFSFVSNSIFYRLCADGIDGTNIESEQHYFRNAHIWGFANGRYYRV